VAQALNDGLQLISSALIVFAKHFIVNDGVMSGPSCANEAGLREEKKIQASWRNNVRVDDGTCGDVTSLLVLVSRFFTPESDAVISPD
jgi:hypothetical protein